MFKETFAYNSSSEYVHGHILMIERKIRLLSWTFYALNLIVILLGSATAITTPLLISKLIFSGFPTWFFLFTGGVSCGVIFISSILNFFVFKEQLKNLHSQKEDIYIEIFKHKNMISKEYRGPNKNYQLYLKVGNILENKSTKRETSHE